MRKDDFFEESGRQSPSIIYMALGVLLFIITVFGVVIAVNTNNKRRPKPNNNPVPVVSPQANDSDKLVASDLNIWGMYPKQEPDRDYFTEEDNLDVENIINPTPSQELPDNPSETDTSLEDKYNDGNHIRIDYEDGSTEWLAINKDWTKNNYDYTNLVNTEGKMQYFKDGRKVSFLGVDVDRYRGDIDFKKVKASGIDFVMIRVGARGYKTGALSLDEYFEDNFNRAIEAGLDVGLYFYSQALTEAEAVEEAELLLNNIKNRPVLYPIALQMDMVDNDVSRVETLTNLDRVKNTAAFLNRIAIAGYKTMIYGDKEWLLKRIDISFFPNSGVWYSEFADLPSYPYPYAIWQYSTTGVVDGINGNVNMNICFIDYRAQ